MNPLGLQVEELVEEEGVVGLGLGRQSEARVAGVGLLVLDESHFWE